MELGAEQKAQQQFVRAGTRKFDALLQDAKAGRIKKDMRSEEVIARYGEPTVEKVRALEGIQGLAVTLLYRNPVVFFGASKVYLDFGTAGRLEAVRIEEADVR